MARDEKARDRGQPRLNRRSYLRLAGAAAVSAAGAGTATTTAAAQYSRTVDIVQAGADDTGSSDISNVLYSLAESGTKIEFPPGRYRLSEFSPGSLSDFALVGDDATIVPPDGMTSTIMSLSGRNVTVEGFTFDYTASNTAPQMSIRCSDGLLMRNCDFVGQADVEGGSGSSGHQYHLFPAVTDAGGEGLIENVSLADGAQSPSNRGGMWIGSNNAGTLVFDGLHMEEWANNSLYCYESAGPIIVQNSFFRNNNVSGPRIGSPGSKVLNTTIVSDGDVPVQAFTGGQHSRGIWIARSTDMVVEGCDFVMTGPYAGAGIVYGASDSNVDVRDCRFRMDVDSPAIDARNGGAGLTIEDVSVTGEASSGNAIYVNARDGTRISNACIQQPNGSRAGIYLDDSSNCSVSDSTINVGGQAIVMSGSSADTSNISYDGTCPVASDEKPTNGSDDSDDSAGDDSGSDDSTGDDSGSDDGSDDGSDTGGELTELISIDGRYADGPVNYRLTVTGDIEKSDVGDSTIDDDDVISGSTAEGSVDGGSDSYAFAGEIEELLLDDDTTIWFNGGQLDESEYTVDPSAFEDDDSDGSTDDSDDGSDDDGSDDSDESTDDSDESTDDSDESTDDSGGSLDNEIVITGGKYNRRTYYDFTVSGDLEKAEIDGASINDTDTVDGSTAEGFVAGGSDAYRFSGEIETFTMDGQGEVVVNGEPVDLGDLPSDLLPNTIVIDGSDANGRSTYTFEVSGEVEKSRSLGTVTAEDEIDGNVVTGVVLHGRDGYRFSGDITRFQLKGSAEVTFEDNDG